MDVYRPRKVGGAGVVLPVVVSEPGAGLRNRDEIASAFVPDVEIALRVAIENALDTWNIRENAADPRQLSGIVDVHVRHLMIGDGECCARPGVEQLIPQFVAHGDETV